MSVHKNVLFNSKTYIDSSLIIKAGLSFFTAERYLKYLSIQIVETMIPTDTKSSLLAFMPLTIITKIQLAKIMTQAIKYLST